MLCLSCSLPRVYLWDWPQFSTPWWIVCACMVCAIHWGPPRASCQQDPSSREMCVLAAWMWQAPARPSEDPRWDCTESRARWDGSDSTQLAMHVRTLEEGAPPQDTLLPSVQKRQKQSASLCCPGWGRHLPDRAVRSLPRGASLPATPRDSDLGCSSRFGGWRAGRRTCLVSRPWVVPAVSGSCWVGCAILFPGSLLLPG